MYEFPVTSPLAAEIRIAAGRVEVTAQPGLTTATVSVEPLDNSDQSQEAAAQTLVELRGTDLIVKAPESKNWLRMRHPRLAVKVAVPADSSLDLTTASADATCSGAFREARVDSASADIFIENVTGVLGVKTASGDIKATHVGGDFKITSASGDVTVAAIDGSAAVHTASGDVELGTVGGDIGVTTASGDVNVRTLHRGSAKVNSASGDIKVGVIAGVGVWMDLTTMSGRARSDLDPAGAPANGQPDVALHLRSMSGDIVVARAAA